MSRFSFSFQQETPTSLQIEAATEVFEKDQDESLLSGSESADLIPSRHLISFSMEKDGVEVKVRRRRVKKKMGLVVFVVIAECGEE